MAISARFEELKSRLQELKLHMLPEEFSPTGNYSEPELDRAKGYRLLVHAEIEAYLEDVSRSVVTNGIRKWKQDGRPSVLIVSFLASYHSSWAVNDDKSNEEIIQIAKSRKNMSDSLNEIVDLAQRQFIAKIRENHGIKENNFKTLIIPTGVDIDSLDQTWLTNLTNFGSSRGEIAHKSKRATGEINPKDEYTMVCGLVDGLETLDEFICEIEATLA